MPEIFISDAEEVSALIDLIEFVTSRSPWVTRIASTICSNRFKSKIDAEDQLLEQVVFITGAAKETELASSNVTKRYNFLMVRLNLFFRVAK